MVPANLPLPSNSRTVELCSISLPIAA
jgi:hypothetical protein